MTHPQIRSEFYQDLQQTQKIIGKKIQILIETAFGTLEKDLDP